MEEKNDKIKLEDIDLKYLNQPVLIFKLPITLFMPILLVALVQNMIALQISIVIIFINFILYKNNMKFIDFLNMLKFMFKDRITLF